MKRYRYIFIGGSMLLLIITTIIATQIMFKDSKDVAYRTERSPIENRFPEIPDFIECYWKADTIGKTNFGPTSYWMRGFVLLDDNALQKILSSYVWSAKSIAFPEGITPDITGKTDFDWHINTEFQRSVLQQRFVGCVYLDIINGILYFDVENN